MKTVNLQQGTPEWHAHRAQHFNASDAPAMLGLSPYKTRAQLIREIATGITEEVDANLQRRFDDGHRYEALARPLAEAIIGEELFPCVGVDGKFSASFDGLTMLEEAAFEHKSLNDAIRAAIEAGVGNAVNLPEHYRVQMEQQCMVSGAARVLFMASKWNGDDLVEERHCWYYPDAALRDRIIAGWEQFEADVAAYVPEAAAAPAAAGRAPDQLPALRVEVTGMVTASNLADFKASALAVLGGINRDLQTDEDFANAETTVKWCKGVEDRLAATKDAVLAQTADIEAVFRTMDEVSEETRRVRLDLDKLVKAEKESRKGEIVTAGREAVRAHYDAINATLGEHRFQPPQTLSLELGGAIKGKKSLSSMRDAVDAAVANAKIAASQQAERVRANVAILAEAADHASLFADRVQLCAGKASEDLRNLVAARIAEHEQREAERLEKERARIRQEEADRLEREQREEAARVERERAAEELAAAKQSTGADLSPAAQQLNEAEGAERFAQRHPAAVNPAATDARINLGHINERIAPLSITADGLAKLGFQPIASKGAAKLYADDDLSRMLNAMASHLNCAAREERWAA
ncbi:lambda-exonuclease family protein [Lysobacter sp. F6437]|uniref:lambda-exonuclease family protein n=1 Tax=Lysobacter sp. F6437 TaxID=3459296 RepID=UPI00403DE623